MKNKYRIVKDNFLGLEVQVKFWWFPVYWFECNSSNTYLTIAEAKKFIESHKKGLTEVVWSE